MSHIDQLAPLVLMVAATVRERLSAARQAGVSTEVDAILGEIDGHLDALTGQANAVITELEGRDTEAVVAEAGGREATVHRA